MRNTKEAYNNGQYDCDSRHILGMSEDIYVLGGGKSRTLNSELFN